MLCYISPASVVMREGGGVIGSILVEFWHLACFVTMHWMISSDCFSANDFISSWFQDYDAAIELSTQALQLRPKCFEAFYARARAKRDSRY